MKIAIIGAGLSGLACARECERLGVIPDVFERDNFVGWIWPSVSIWLNVFEKKMGGDIRDYLREVYHLDLKPLSECKRIIMKSSGRETIVEGNLGYLVSRGTIEENSIEKQLRDDLKQTTVHLNRPADYKELAGKYDFVVVANGKDMPAKEMGVWEEYGPVYIRGAVAVGNFKTDTAVIYWNKEYAGQGYARIAPFSSTSAIVGLYYIGEQLFEMDKHFNEFIEQEGLAHLEYMYKLDVPVFSTGKVRQFRVGNVLLAGRAAGLTERLLGSGGLQAMISGILAARAIIKDLDYDSLVKPLQDHLENISAFRKHVENLDNQGYDRLLKALGIPGVKQVIYNSPLNLTDMVGGVLRKVQARPKNQDTQ